MNHEPRHHQQDDGAELADAHPDAAAMETIPDRSPDPDDTSRVEHIEPLRQKIEIGPDSARAVQFVLHQLTTQEQQIRVLNAYLRLGPPFAAFLLLKDTAPNSPTLEAEFADTYVGSWQEPDQLIDDTLDSLGWKQALDDFLKTNGIEYDYLTWNYSELAIRLKDMYDIIEVDDWQHVFHK